MKKIMVAGLILSVMSTSQALTLEEYLKKVETDNKKIQSLGYSLESAKAKRISGDVELSPILSASVGYLSDEKPTSLPSLMGTKTTATQVSLGLAKQFSTGTQAQVAVSGQEAEVDGTTPATDKSGTGALSFAISQSLWKNGFGSGTRLRQERESYVESAEKAGVDLQKRQVMIEAEAAYWNYIYAREEVSVRRSSLDRAKKLQDWMTRRVRDGISDQSDLVEVQSLVNLRDLQLLNAEDEYLASNRKIAEILDIQDLKNVPSIEGTIDQKRSVTSLIGAMDSKQKVIRLDAFLSQQQSQAALVASKEVENSLRPDLVLEGKYSTNSKEDSLGNAISETSDTSLPTTAVALKLTWMIDDGTKKSTREAARLQAMSSQLETEKKRLESEYSWSEIQRRYLELSKKIDSAEKIADLRQKNASNQKDKLSKGRTVTSTVIDAEENADEAQLTLIKLKAEQRKLESQARLFVVAQEG